MERRNVTQWLCTALVLCCISFSICQDPNEQSNMDRLREDLLKNYNKYTLPVKDHTKTTEVNIGLTLVYIADLDEEKQFLSADVWIFMNWVDTRLSWKPENYNGLQTLRLKDDEIWQPDLTVYNSHDSKIDPTGETLVIASSNGSLLWVPPSTFHTRCFVDVRDYPNDRQSCNITLGSWTHNEYEINLQLMGTEANLEHFSNTNPHWKLVGTSAERISKTYACCPEPYVSVTFTFDLQRRTPAYVHMTWAPMTVALLMTLAIFWIPPHSGEKILLGGFVALIMLSLMEFVAASVPSPAARRAAVAPFHAALLTVMSAIVVEIIICMNMTAFRRTCRPPQFLVTLLSGACGKLLWVCKPRTSSSDVLEDQPERMSPYEEWYLVASAIDRVLFIIYVVVIIAIPKV